MSKYLEDRVSELESKIPVSLIPIINQLLRDVKELQAVKQPETCTDKPSDKEETILCGRCCKRLCTYTYTSVVAHKDWMPVCMECFDKLVAR